MTTFIATSVQTNGNTPRIWLEGLRLARGQFTPATRYDVLYKDGVVILRASKEGSRKVSARKEKPIIDLCSKVVGSWFPVGTKLKAVVRKGRIVIRRLASAVKALKRDRDLLRKVRNGEALDVVSLFHGGGVMDRAVHEGLARAGLNSRIHAAVEIDGRYLDASLRANSDLFDEKTLVINAPIQDVDLTTVKPASLMTIGLPCTGMSKAGRSKGKLSSAEAHPEAGALFFSALQWIGHFQPAAVTMECTPELLTSPSLSVIRSVLLNWDYDLFEANLNGVTYGTLENRNRACIIAMSRNLAEASGFDLADIKPLRIKEEKLSDIFEPISNDDARWTIHTYLETKEKEDIAKGNGFRRQLYTGTESHINTIRRGYARVGGTDPHIKHPTKARYTRLLTVLEHARVKGIDEAWIKACQVADTVAHQIMGQSVCAPVFEAVGAAVGHALATATQVLAPIKADQPASNDHTFNGALAV